jgi:aspartyl-tRNA(Asn)/glutamyl-tRNA(Gln) amidotransferase subunit A
VRCTNGSKFFADYVPNQDAECIRRLRRAGAILVGKTNLHELCFGATSQNPHYGRCRNPWNPEHVPSGSSGGAGASLAADMCLGAVGSDTGGSIRMPAAVNGVAGLRPSLGAISMRGSKIQISPTIDTVGPMARRVTDVARMFAVMVGYDDEDPASIPHEYENFLATIHDGIAGLRIGLPRRFYFEDLHPDFGPAIEAAVDRLQKLGAKLIEIDLPGAPEAQSKVMPMMLCDVAAFHRERLDNHPEMFGEDVLGRMRLGLQFTGRDYADALRWREQWARTIARAFTQVDLLLTPTTPIPAPKIDDVKRTLETTLKLSRFTFGFSFAQLPGLSIPCGFTREGLPIGMQVHGPAWSEGSMFRLGAAYQGTTDWHLRRPAILN